MRSCASSVTLDFQANSQTSSPRMTKQSTLPSRAVSLVPLQLNFIYRYHFRTFACKLKLKATSKTQQFLELILFAFFSLMNWMKSVGAKRRGEL